VKPALNLDQELRFHLPKDLHRFVARLLDGEPPSELAPLAEQLAADRFHLRITRSPRDRFRVWRWDLKARAVGEGRVTLYCGRIWSAQRSPEGG
jgi:hypothetical protein